MSNEYFYELLDNWVTSAGEPGGNKFYFVIDVWDCGTFLVPVYKKQTRRDLYFNIGTEVFREIPDTIRLYIKQDDMNNISMAIPSDDVIIEDWINDIWGTIECITSGRAPAAFRLWMDDGSVN